MGKKKAKLLQAHMQDGNADQPPSTMPAVSHVNYFTPGFLLFCALLIRFFYLQQTKSDLFMTDLIIDAKFYDSWAQKILTGGWLGNEAFYQDPLYAYFLAYCYKLFGHHVAIVRLVQALIDTATLGLLYFIGAKIFNARTGLIALVAGALYGPMVYYTGLLDKTTLTTFLVALSLATLAYTITIKSYRAYFACGLVFGLAAMARGNMLIVALGFSAWIAFKNTAISPLSIRIKYSGIFLCGVIMMVGMVALRNYRVSKDVVLITSNIGINFFIGNNAHTAGNYVEPPFIHGIPDEEYADSKFVAERSLGKSLTKASEVSAFWFRQGVEFIRQHPDEWMLLMARKIFLLFNWFEIPETYSFYYFRENYRALLAPFITFGLIFTFGVMGMASYFRKKGLNEIHLFLILYSASLLLFFVTSRYRFPVVLPLLLFSAWFLSEVYERRKVMGHKPLFSVLLATAGLFLFANWTPDWMARRIVHPGLSTPHTIKGTMLLGSGDIQGAINELEKARRIFPQEAMIHGQLGMCYSKLGKSDQAIEAYTEAIKRNPLFHEVYNNLASEHYKRGDFPSAFEAIKKAISIKPNEAHYQQSYDRLARLMRNSSSSK